MHTNIYNIYNINVVNLERMFILININHNKLNIY